ncbi:transcriptional regulator [Bacillus cereus]|uniref:transcriptional regulator n=1 Tax=Bacillus cereus TaxID=1396 RepID=UPI003D17DB52
MGKPKIYTQEQLEKAIDLYMNKADNGMRLRDILKETNVPSNALYSALREREIETQGITIVNEYPNLEEGLELYKRRGELGLTVLGIASKLNIPTSRFYAELEARGYKGRPRGRKYTQENLDKAVELYQNKSINGLRIRDILEQTNVPQSAFHIELNLRGIERTGNSRLGDLEKAIELYVNREENGLLVRDIIKTAKISPTTFYGELRKRNLMEEK